MAVKNALKNALQERWQAEGEEKTVQGVLDVVLQDKVFYEESGGGITLSGGEM